MIKQQAPIDNSHDADGHDKYNDCHQRQTSHCASVVEHGNAFSFDGLLWVSVLLVTTFYFLHLFFSETVQITWLADTAQAIYQLINTMWWSLLLAMVFVGLLTRVPREFVISILGVGGTWQGLFRACLAGLLMDLCSHGILMVAMQLYQRGASLGQVMAFLISSPWNSLSLTLILIALIGLPWTLLFIALSMVIAIISGRMFDRFVTSGVLPRHDFPQTLPKDFKFWPAALTGLRQVEYTPKLFTTILWEGIKGSRMVLRWILFGLVVAAVIRGTVAIETYQTLFGPTVLGLGLTLLVATLLEVCSEGSSPIAADLLTRGGAPGNSFAFLMSGVATDYTEIMSIKDTTASWKIAMFLPLLTLPQIIVMSLLLNHFAA